MQEDLQKSFQSEAFYGMEASVNVVKHRSFDDLIDLVGSWAIHKGLVSEANATRQMLKVMEEVGEVAGALAKGNRDDLIDAIGDSFVTLIILSKQMSIDPDYALGVAYDVIKNRKGKTENGVFIKDK
jgi:NTP pyrophosphatase (non-canonical NTP hydrolase)